VNEFQAAHLGKVRASRTPKAPKALYVSLVNDY